MRIVLVSGIPNERKLRKIEKLMGTFGANYKFYNYVMGKLKDNKTGNLCYHYKKPNFVDVFLETDENFVSIKFCIYYFFGDFFFVFLTIKNIFHTCKYVFCGVGKKLKNFFRFRLQIVRFCLQYKLNKFIERYNKRDFLFSDVSYDRNQLKYDMVMRTVDIKISKLSSRKLELGLIDFIGELYRNKRGFTIPFVVPVFNKVKLYMSVADDYRGDTIVNFYCKNLKNEKYNIFGVDESAIGITRCLGQSVCVKWCKNGGYVISVPIIMFILKDKIENI